MLPVRHCLEHTSAHLLRPDGEDCKSASAELCLSGITRSGHLVISRPFRENEM